MKTAASSFSGLPGPSGANQSLIDVDESGGASGGGGGMMTGQSKTQMLLEEEENIQELQDRERSVRQLEVGCQGNAG